MKKNKYFFGFVILSILMSACGNKNVSDIVDNELPDNVEIVNENSSEMTNMVDTNELDDSLKDITAEVTDELDKSNLIFVEGIELEDYEGFWFGAEEGYLKDKEKAYKGNGYFCANIVDGYISVALISGNRNVVWSGNLVKTDSSDGLVKLLSKKSNYTYENSDLEIKGESLEFVYEDGLLSFDYSADERVYLTLRTKKITSRDSDFDNVYIETSNELPLNLIKNLEITYKKSDAKDIYLFLTNNSDQEVNNIYTSCYGLDEYSNIMPIVYVDKFESFGIDKLFPGQTAALRLSTHEEVPNIAVNCSAYEYSFGNNCLSADSVEIESNRIADDLEIRFTNVSDADIESIIYLVVFYKDGKIVDIDKDKIKLVEDIADFDSQNITKEDSNYYYTDIINSGETVVEKLDVKQLDYDDYEIYTTMIIGK